MHIFLSVSHCSCVTICRSLASLWLKQMRWSSRPPTRSIVIIMSRFQKPARLSSFWGIYWPPSKGDSDTLHYLCVSWMLNGVGTAVRCINSMWMWDYLHLRQHVDVITWNVYSEASDEINVWLGMFFTLEKKTTLLDKSDSFDWNCLFISFRNIQECLPWQK